MSGRCRSPVWLALLTLLSACAAAAPPRTDISLDPVPPAPTAEPLATHPPVTKPEGPSPSSATVGVYGGQPDGPPYGGYPSVAEEGVNMVVGNSASSSLPAGAPPSPRARPKSPWSCPFPAQPDDDSVDHAAVLLVLEVDAGGKVQSASVAHGAGGPFDRAARACALNQSFEPARDEAGHPVASKLTLRVVFSR